MTSRGGRGRLLLGVHLLHADDQRHEEDYVVSRLHLHHHVACAAVRECEVMRSEWQAIQFWVRMTVRVPKWLMSTKPLSDTAAGIPFRENTLPPCVDWWAMTVGAGSQHVDGVVVVSEHLPMVAVNGVVVHGTHQFHPRFPRCAQRCR